MTQSIEEYLESVEDPAAELARIEEEIRYRRRITELIASIPPVHRPFLRPARNKGGHGGRGSTKSWTFARLCIIRAMQRPGIRIVCIREVQRTLSQSVKRLLEDNIKRFGLEDQFEVLAHHIRCPGDGIIIFQGMQDHTAESIKSLEGFDIAWVEEAQTLSQRSLDLLRPTLRKEDSELWFSWNPRFPTDPVDQFLRHGAPPRSIVIQSTYRDNPALPSVLREELEWDRNRDPEKFDHIWEGGYEKNAETRVFKNWVIEDFETPPDAPFLFGGDWGYSIDPTVLVRGWADQEGRRLFIDAEAYQVNCEIDDTPALFDTIDNGMARQWPIIADSARPETISYLQRHGYPLIEAAKKGPNSVAEGIQFLQSYDIIIHPRCVHVKDEFTMYSFKRHPQTGMVLAVLQDKKNHTIDSCRYMIEPIRNPDSGKLTW